MTFHPDSMRLVGPLQESMKDIKKSTVLYEGLHTSLCQLS